MTRLSSALQSWTGVRSTVGEGLRTGLPREGRPGPHGARYTQQREDNQDTDLSSEPPPNKQMENKPHVHSALATAEEVANAESHPHGHEGGREDNKSDGCNRNTDKTDATSFRGVAGHVAATGPVSGALTAPDVGRAGAEVGAISTSFSATTTSALQEKRPKKKGTGIWELKAERSRLEQAVKEAEAERDMDKARADETAILLKQAMARLDNLRQKHVTSRQVPLDRSEMSLPAEALSGDRAS